MAIVTCVHPSRAKQLNTSSHPRRRTPNPADLAAHRTLARAAAPRHAHRPDRHDRPNHRAHRHPARALRRHRRPTPAADHRPTARLSAPQRPSRRGHTRTSCTKSRNAAHDRLDPQSWRARRGRRIRRMSFQAVVLAGGKGARLRPFTHVLPKPLLPIGERPILDVSARGNGGRWRSTTSGRRLRSARSARLRGLSCRRSHLSS